MDKLGLFAKVKQISIYYVNNYITYSNKYKQ